MNQIKQIGNVQVTAREWKKGPHHRLYFSADTGGQACWDLKNQRWVKVKREFGGRFKHHIRETFGL